MHKRHYILIITVGIVVLAVAVLIKHLMREPSYNGRSLTWWVLAYQRQFPMESEIAAVPNTPAGLQAREAIRQIGDKAVPYLVSWMQKKHWSARLIGGPDARRFGAVRAIHVLGPQAQRAVKPLIQMLEGSDEERAIVAIYALSGVGEAGLAPLMAALKHTNATLRSGAVVALRYQTTNASPAIPLLVQCLQDKDPELVRDAAQTLGVLKMQPGEVVVPLAGCLQHSNANVRTTATAALEWYGSEAKLAVPALLGALQDPDISVRYAATSALLKITLAPNILTNAHAR